MWLYINKIRVFEFVSNGSASIPCYVVYFSSAAAPGKYKIGCYVILALQHLINTESLVAI